MFPVGRNRTSVPRGASGDGEVARGTTTRATTDTGHEEYADVRMRAATAAIAVTLATGVLTGRAGSRRPASRTGTRAGPTSGPPATPRTRRPARSRRSRHGCSTPRPGSGTPRSASRRPRRRSTPPGGTSSRPTARRTAAEVADEQAAGRLADMRDQYADVVASSYEMAPSLTALAAILDADGIRTVVDRTASYQNAQSAHGLRLRRLHRRLAAGRRDQQPGGRRAGRRGRAARADAAGPRRPRGSPSAARRPRPTPPRPSARR